MQIAHGCFEGLVAHGLLDGAGIDTVFQGMGGVAVTEVVFQMAEVAVPRELFRSILQAIGRLSLPAVASG
ncbi:MAG: hypothetical protein ABSE16_19405 [Verrucomicrobiota bacterium]